MDRKRHPPPPFSWYQFPLNTLLCPDNACWPFNVDKTAIHLDELPNKFCVPPCSSTSHTLSLNFPLINSILSTEICRDLSDTPCPFLYGPSGSPVVSPLVKSRHLCSNSQAAISGTACVAPWTTLSFQTPPLRPIKYRARKEPTKCRVLTITTRT